MLTETISSFLALLRGSKTKFGRRKKSKAFLVYCEWGPELSIPREKRLKDKFPELPIQIVDQWINDFKEYEKIAYDLAILHRKEGWKSEVTAKKLNKIIPYLDIKAINKLLSQACYYAWHEGY